MSDKLKTLFSKLFNVNKYKFFSSLILAFTAPFVLIIGASLSVYFSNYKELHFHLSSFLPAFLISALVISLILLILLVYTRNTLRSIIYTLCSYVVIAGYIQSVVTTITFKGLPGDGVATAPESSAIIINLLIWLFVGLFALYFGVLWFRQMEAQRIMSFALLVILTMQTVSLIPLTFSYIRYTFSEDNNRSYLSEENLTEISSDENIVLFVIDRFDREYFLDLAKKSPESLDAFKDFTYYDDNVSTYPRTYPAITSMITGVNTDFSLSREEYFESAYTTSPFIKDLIDNDYNINLYTSFYYSYDNADVLSGIASNVEENGRYEVIDSHTYLKSMAELSTYFWAPEILKSQSISSGSFSSVVSLTGEHKGYSLSYSSDPGIYSQLTEQGLSTDSIGNKKNFTFLHLRGCHYPFTMDENCNEVDHGTVSLLQQTKGCFKMISEYMEQMKKLGVYDNSTIIITGDHSTLMSDHLEYMDENLTALLVKQKNQKGTELTTSHAPVSQDNLHAEIVKSAGIKTTHDYGTAYSDVPEDANITRVHYFQMNTASSNKSINVTYEITGPGTDFENWKITKRETIGSIYE